MRTAFVLGLVLLLGCGGDGGGGADGFVNEHGWLCSDETEAYCCGDGVLHVSTSFGGSDSLCPTDLGSECQVFPATEPGTGGAICTCGDLAAAEGACTTIGDEWTNSGSVWAECFEGRSMSFFVCSAGDTCVGANECASPA